jgi:site-specific recombinase XerD
MVKSRTEPPNKGHKYPPEPLTPFEAAAIIGQCSPRAPTGIRNRAMLTLFYRSGLRVSELLALRPVDLNLADHSARVLHGKGNRATVRYWHPSADDTLLRWLDERKRRGLARSGARLFCTLAGDPVSDDYVRNLLRRLAVKAGVEKRVHPHGLRHSYAVELRKARMDIAAISKLLGHSSVSVTARYLDHLTNDEAGKALVALDLAPLGEK